MEDLLRVCGACGTELETVDDPDAGDPIGLIEDGTALCRSCATDADREYDLPSLDAAA